ncbi:MAG: SDR family NAD(P)-dependent oxidoreductase, partial [Povalibacter sp.]
MATVPSASDVSLTEEDVLTCVRVLRAIEQDRSHLTRLTQAQRIELLSVAGRVVKPERSDMVKMAKAFRRADREKDKVRDREALERTALRVQRKSEVYRPLWLERPDQQPSSEQSELKQERTCYICKQSFTRVHRYYDSMCESCGEFNYSKREQHADLTGQYALVSGARVKIGYQTSLKLLRAGAYVIATTRFPVDAADRYSQELDYRSFSDRLEVHGLDLRHTPSVELFARMLLDRLPRLDHIINNACQTVRRPAGFYAHLLAREATSFETLPDMQRVLLKQRHSLRHTLEQSSSIKAISPTMQIHAEGLIDSAELSQRRYLDDDFRAGDALFPTGRYDEDRQQVDLR